MKKTLLIALIFFVTDIYSQSQQLTTKLEAIKNSRGILGMSVTVVKNDGVSFSHGFGLRDVGRNLPVNDSTIYRIASISKMVAAIALMQLYEKGLINLDSDISNYLGFNLRNPSSPNDIITVRKVISHTASIRDGSGYDGFLSATYNQNPPPNIQALLTPGGAFYSADMFSNTKPPNSNYFQYANVNFGIIGTVVERVSGKRFDIYCRENIFIPLGMDAGYNIQDISSFNDLAVLYRKSGGQWVAQADDYNGIKPPPRNFSQYVIGNNGLIFGPQGGLRTSARDLSKILTALLNSGLYANTRLLSDSTCARLRVMNWIYDNTNGNNYYGIFNSYSYGQHKTTELLPTEILYGHPGEAYGLISDAYYSIDKRFGVVFITNGGQWGNGVYSGWYDVEEDVFQACLSEMNNLTSVKEEPIEQDGFTLLQNYPNPFNPATTIVYTLAESAFVKLSVLNPLGEGVAELISEYSTPGSFSARFKPENLPSGVYFYKLSILNKGGRMATTYRKMIYIR